MAAVPLLFAFLNNAVSVCQTNDKSVFRCDMTVIDMGNDNNKTNFIAVICLNCISVIVYTTAYLCVRKDGVFWTKAKRNNQVIARPRR